MAWGLPQNVDFWTGNLSIVSHPISQADLEPGDILLNPAVHTILFAGWSNAAHTTFDMYEESHPGVPAHIVVNADYASYASSGFTPMRYNLIQDGGTGTSTTSTAAGRAVSGGVSKAQSDEPPLTPAGVVVYSPLLNPGAVPAHLPAPPPIAYTDGGGTILGSPPATVGSAQRATSSESSAVTVARQNRSAKRSDPVAAGSALALMLACKRALGGVRPPLPPPQQNVATAPPGS